MSKIAEATVAALIWTDMSLSEKLLLSAFDQLVKEGRSEEFVRLSVEIMSGRSTAFFEDFEGPGCFIQIGRDDGEPWLKFGAIRNWQGFWARFREACAILFRRDTAYEMHLNEVNVARMKNVLRHLEMLNERNKEATDD